MASEYGTDGMGSPDHRNIISCSLKAAPRAVVHRDDVPMLGAKISRWRRHQMSPTWPDVWLSLQRMLPLAYDLDQFCSFLQQ